MAELSEDIKLGADASGVEVGVGRAKRSLADLGATAERTGKTAGDGIGKMGEGSDKAARSVERATKSMQGQIQRLIASFEGGERGSRKFYESLAKQRGVDANALKPLLDQLDAVRSKSALAAQATESAGGSFGSLGAAAGLAARALAAIGIANLASDFIRLADASTNIASRLTLVTTSSAELVAVQQQLFAVAQSARVSYVDLAGTYTQMARATQELGVSQRDMLAITKTISQAVTISGASASSAQAALTQLSQGFAAGALRGEELNSVLEQTPRLAQAIAQGLGVGIGQLREMGKAGELTAEAVLGALQKSAPQVAEEFERMAVTVEGASTNAANSMMNLVGAIDEATGVSGALAASIQATSRNIDDLALSIRGMTQTNSLSDFFFLAFNNQKTLNFELEASQERLELLEARLARSPSNIYARSAAQDMREYVAEIKEAQARLAQLSGQAAPRDPRDQSGFTTRSQGYTAEAARQAKLAEDLNAFKLKQSGVSSGYIKDMQEIIRLNQAGVLVGKEYTDALAAQQKALLDRSGARVASTKAENAANKEMENQARLIAELSGLTSSFAGDWQLLTNAYNGGRLSLEALTVAQGQLLAKQPFAVALAKEEAEAVKEMAKARDADAKAFADTIELRQSAAATVAEQVTKEREAIQVMGLTRIELAELEAAKLEDAAASKARLAAIADEIDWSGQAGDAYRAEAAQLRELADLKRSGAVRAASVDAAEDAAKAWKDTAGKIEDTLTDALMRGFERGESFGENLADTIVNTFKTYVAREIASAITRAIVSAMAGTQWGALLNSVMGGAGNGGTGGTNWVSSASSAYRAYQGFQSGQSAANIAGTYYANATGTGIDGLLATNNAYGTGGAGGFNSAATGAYAAGIAGGVYGGRFASAGYSAFGGESGNSAVNTGTAIGALFGPWGALIGGIIGGLVNSFFGTKIASQGIAGNFDGAGGIQTAQFKEQRGGLFRDDKVYYDPLGDGGQFEQQLRNLRAGMEETASVLGLGADAVKNFAGSINLDLAGLDPAEAAERTKEEFTKLQAQMLATASFAPELGSNFDEVRDAAVEMGLTLEEASAHALEVLNREDAIKRQSFEQLTNSYIELINQAEQVMIQAGITSENLSNVIVAGMTGRLSEADVGAQLADIVLGGIYNTIASGFAAQISDVFMQQIIQPIMVAVTAGVPLATAISQQAMATVVAQAQQSAAVLRAIFDDPVFRQTMADLQNTIGGIASAVVGPSRSIRRFGTAALAAGQAAEQAAKQIASERYSLETRLLQLQGNTTELRRRELEQLHPTNRALQQQIWALEDQQAAAEKAARAAEELRRAWAGAVDSMIDEVKRIRGEIVDSSQNSLAYLQAQFSITTAQARAGDIAAAESLPDISRRLLEMAELNATSLIDLQRLRAWLAASLEETASLAQRRVNETTTPAAGTTNTPGAALNQPPPVLIGVGSKSSPLRLNEPSGLEATIRDLVDRVDTFMGNNKNTPRHIETIDRVLRQVTEDGRAMQSESI